MPWNEAQRKLFNAAARRGEPGMSKLASEANELYTQGAELPPVGVAGTAAHILNTPRDEESDALVVDGVSGTKPWSKLRGTK